MQVYIYSPIIVSHFHHIGPNTTFILEAEADPQPFLDWARHRYIPAALASPGIDSHLLAHIDNPADGSTRSYALQLVLEDETAAALWEGTAEALRSSLEKIYGRGHVVWFSTFMEIISRSLPEPPVGSI